MGFVSKYIFPFLTTLDQVIMPTNDEYLFSQEKPDKSFIGNVRFNIKVDVEGYRLSEYLNDIEKALLINIGRRNSNDNGINVTFTFQYLIRSRLGEEFPTEDSICIITDFSISEGSFLLLFGFFVYTAIKDYNDVRISLENIKLDLNSLFRNSFGPVARIDIDYSTKATKIQQGPSRNMVNRLMAPLHKQIAQLTTLTRVLGIFTILLVAYVVFKEANPPEKKSDDETGIIVQNAVRSEMDRITTQKTFEEILRRLQRLETQQSKPQNPLADSQTNSNRN